MRPVGSAAALGWTLVAGGGQQSEGFLVRHPRGSAVPAFIDRREPRGSRGLPDRANSSGSKLELKREEEDAIFQTLRKRPVGEGHPRLLTTLTF